MRETRRLMVTAAALALATAVAACGGGGGKISSGTTVHGKPQHGGTVTIAEVAESPNAIFPIPSATNSNGYNFDLGLGLWPPMIYIGNGAQTSINQQESVVQSVPFTP